MPRIRCHYLDCAFLDDGYCTAGMVEIDPDAGCKTYSANAESTEDDNWEDENELDEWEEIGEDEEDEELWSDDAGETEEEY